MSEIENLAQKQLIAYNEANLDAFCACYHPDVRVLDDQGEESIRGAELFRRRYEVMFKRGGFGAEVPQRISLGIHCVDKEYYWRSATEEQGEIRGEVLVRYTLRDHLIGTVQFLRPE